QTLGQFLATWLEDSVRPTVRPKTYDSYAQVVRLYIEPELGRVQLGKLTPQQIQHLLNKLLKMGLAPRTVRYCHAILKMALGRAYKWSLVPRNVAQLVDAPRSLRYEMRSLTPEEARVFLTTVRGDRLEALYSVAIALGLRQGEALGLRWEDVDMDKCTLRVRYALQRIDGKPQLVEPKTQKSRRTIFMPQVTVNALRTHRIRQLEERLAAGERWKESGLVFTSTIGTPLDPRNAFRSFQDALQRAGLPHIRFHDLRHTCASLLLAQGVHPRVVMEALGHSQISLTMDTYSHVIPALQKEAADRMDALLSEG
ncbi:MAG: site-specific integrase, partial [Chloroflexi bacterium]|nr:site-specific integrase [Chloroflexota bacterium]